MLGPLKDVPFSSMKEKPQKKNTYMLPNPNFSSDLIFFIFSGVYVNKSKWPAESNLKPRQIQISYLQYRATQKLNFHIYLSFDSSLKT